MFRNGSEVQKCTAMEASDGKIFEVMTSTYPLLDINILSQFPSVFHLPGSLNMSVLLVAPFTFAVWFKKNSIWRLNNPTLLKNLNYYSEIQTYVKDVRTRSHTPLSLTPSPAQIRK
jgi:hypothetical protein